MKKIWLKIKTRAKTNWTNYRNNRKKNFTLQMVGNYGVKKYLSIIGRSLFLLFMVIIVVFPFYWMIITSFKTDQELDPTKDPTWWPKEWSLKMYDYLWNSLDISITKYLFNSFLVAFLSTFLKLFICSLAGFGLARYRTKYREIIFIILLSTMMLPGEAIMIGQFIFVLKIQWDDTLPALIVPFIASIFTIYMMRQAFEGIPKSVQNAAKIDGASTLKYFFKIALPLVRPVLWTGGIISFIASWNSVLWPTWVLTSNSEWVTMPMLLWELTKISGADQLDISTLRDPQNLKMAGATIAVLPMLILYLLCKNQIIKGITKNSGTKG